MANLDASKIKDIIIKKKSNSIFWIINIAIFIASGICFLIFECVQNIPAPNYVCYLLSSLLYKISVAVFTGYIVFFFTSYLPLFLKAKEYRPSLKQSYKRIRNDMPKFNQIMSELGINKKGQVKHRNDIFRHHNNQNVAKFYIKSSDMQQKINIAHDLCKAIKNESEYLMEHSDFVEGYNIFENILRFADQSITFTQVFPEKQIDKKSLEQIFTSNETSLAYTFDPNYKLPSNKLHDISDEDDTVHV